MNSRATGRRIHGLRKGFGSEARRRGYRAVTLLAPEGKADGLETTGSGVALCPYAPVAALWGWREMFEVLARGLSSLWALEASPFPASRASHNLSAVLKRLPDGSVALHENHALTKLSSS
jgi:hypothetical protein